MPTYSYAELKGKIKVGDRVKFEGHDAIVTKVGEAEFRLDVDRGLFVMACTRPWDAEGTIELLTEEKTLDTVDVGDVVVDKYGGERTILDKSLNGTILFLSQVDDATRCTSYNTRQELKGHGFTVKQSAPAPEPKEMTLEELSKALGYPVKIVE